jgi:hypothetical protein
VVVARLIGGQGALTAILWVPAVVGLGALVVFLSLILTSRHKPGG